VTARHRDQHRHCDHCAELFTVRGRDMARLLDRTPAAKLLTRCHACVALPDRNRRWHASVIGSSTPATWSGSHAMNKKGRHGPSSGVATPIKVEMRASESALGGPDMGTVMVAVLVLALAPGCTSLHNVRLQPADAFAA
jgi:hypothetical protein